MNRRFLIGAVVAGVTACAVQADDWSEFPIPDYAEEIDTSEFSEGNARQIAFVVDRPYPFNGVRDFYFGVLPDSWEQISWGTTGWERHLDATRTPEVWVHQFLTAWVDREQSRMLMLALRYESEYDATTGCIAAPDNTRQMVLLNEYKEEDIDAAIRFLGQGWQEGPPPSN